MRLGILDTLGLLGSLVFAIPVGNFGVDRLLAGETAMGVALLGVAVAMVLVPHYFLDPQTIATKLLGGLLPNRLRSDPEPPTDDETPPN